MIKKLIDIRKKAIKIKKSLTPSRIDHQPHISKLNMIILGTMRVKWMHIFASCLFIFFAAAFIYWMYPDTENMIMMLSFAAGGYALCLSGVLLQIKLYERTMGKISSVLWKQMVENTN